MPPTTATTNLLLVLLLFTSSTPSAVLGASRDVWPASAYVNARAAVAELTVAEKVSLASGNNLAYANQTACNGAKWCSYVGWIQGIPRLGISDIYLEDGPQVR